MADPTAAPCYESENADLLLGLGVRVGVYLQVFSAIINLKLDNDDAPGGAWLQVFTAVPILAFGLKFVLERSISNAIFLATSYLGYMQLLIMPAVLLMPAVRCLRLLVALMVVSIAWSFGLLLWFWADGYQRLEVPECGKTYGFLFAKVPAFGWYRWFNIGVLAVAAAAYLALMALLAPSTQFSRRLLEQVRREFNRPMRIGVALIVLWILLILGVELTIHWNGIVGVYSLASTGQIYPLLIGAGIVTRDAYFYWARRQACVVSGLDSRVDVEPLHGAKTALV